MLYLIHLFASLAHLDLCSFIQCRTLCLGHGSSHSRLVLPTLLILRKTFTHRLAHKPTECRKSLIEILFIGDCRCWQVDKPTLSRAIVHCGREDIETDDTMGAGAWLFTSLHLDGTITENMHKTQMGQAINLKTFPSHSLFL